MPFIIQLCFFVEGFFGEGFFGGLGFFVRAGLRDEPAPARAPLPWGGRLMLVYFVNSRSASHGSCQ